MKNDGRNDGACCGRRGFLKVGGLTLLVAGLDRSLVRGAARSSAAEPRPGKASGRTLVYVFQRFGADGLNTVVPIEPSEHGIYRGFRPTLHVPRDHPRLGKISPDFAFHPAMHDGLFRLWREGRVAVLPNVGYPDGSRSHFDSQLFVENGTPWDKTTRGGWLNRYLLAAKRQGGPLRALAFGPTMPRSLVGEAPAITLTDLKELGVSSADEERNRAVLDLHRRQFEAPAAGAASDALYRSGRDLLAAIDAIPRDLPPPTVPYPKGDFGRSMSQLAQLLRLGVFDIEVAEVDIGGWDHHAQQASDVMTGSFPDLLRQISDGIAAFVDDLGAARRKDVLVLTTSEFGRTSRENGDRGTDHGSAWASFAIGAGVKGGIYFGPEGWHGLTDLREDRDLKHSLDFRDVSSEALARHLGTLTPEIFPGWKYAPIGFLA